MRRVTPWLASFAAAATLVLVAPSEAVAYDTYSADGSTGNCATCHGDFRQSPYTCMADGQSWADDLHDVHRNTMLGGDCDTCHSGSGRSPVYLGTSAGGSGLAAISCVGCHGRAADGSGSGSRGYGAGLRQHHYRAGQTLCLSCHTDSNPAHVVAGENVLPPYYANPGTNHPNIPRNSCNPAPGYPENFKGTTQALDNDGDDAYDAADGDCAPQAVCGNRTVETGEQCDDGNTANGDCCSSTCRYETAGSACNDALYCTVGEICNGSGACGGATARDCGDGVTCTTDSCNEATDQCIHTANNAVCDDGRFCTGVETCSVTLDCQPGTAPDCADTDICTDDTCSPTTDQCVHTYDPTNDPSCVETACGNLRVEPGEQCDDGNTASGDCCSPTCQLDAAGTPCDDGLYCSTGDTCDGGGVCDGQVRNCGDGVGCTVDLCDETGDVCRHDPNDAQCNDGLYCTGAETCNATLDCQGGPAPDCDDTDICTDDVCNEASDRCDNTFDPSNAQECRDQCPDDDDDGVSTAGGSCGPVDCDDRDATVRPGAQESCLDDKDNDCDGLIDAADSSCGLTGTTNVRPGPLANAAYAGSQACAPCHAAQFDTWQSSLHARMLIRPGDAQAAGFPFPRSATFPGNAVTAQSWSDILFLIGQKWRTFWVNKQGRIEPVQWNFGNGTLGSYDGAYDPSAPSHFNYDCGGCHTTGYDAAASFRNDRDEVVPGIVGSWVEYGIGCEACHGPAAEHVAAPSVQNINRITLDWTATDEGVRRPAVRSAEVCANCHYRGVKHITLEGAYPQPSGSVNPGQANDWGSSPHASSLETTTLSTYCAKCHSPGNADYNASEHNFTYFEPKNATHATCISCHDPHRISSGRWAALAWPEGGSQDPKDHPPSLARYLGTDQNPQTRDYRDFANENSNDLCSDCHKLQPGFRRHVDASPDAVVVLEPPYSQDQTFEVPHAEHIEEENARCVDCHMPYTRRSANVDDLRSHTLLPNDRPVGGVSHYDHSCGKCHSEALECGWCHRNWEISGKSLRPRGSIPTRPVGLIRSSRTGSTEDPGRRAPRK